MNDHFDGPLQSWNYLCGSENQDDRQHMTLFYTKYLQDDCQHTCMTLFYTKYLL